jgi:hypothetical protein
MDAALAGLAVGIPLAIASVAIAWFLIRAMLQAADKPGLSPTVIPVVLLVGVAMLLYASNPGELAPLGDLAGVGLGGLVGLLVGRATAPEEPPQQVSLDEIMEAQNPVYADDLTEPVPDAEGIPPEDVVVPDDIEALGKDAR